MGIISKLLGAVLVGMCVYYIVKLVSQNKIK